jgi:hypothetical protein
MTIANLSQTGKKSEEFIPHRCQLGKNEAISDKSPSINNMILILDQSSRRCDREFNIT